MEAAWLLLVVGLCAAAAAPGASPDKLLVVAIACVTSIRFVLAQPGDGVRGDDAGGHDGRSSLLDLANPEESSISPPSIAGSNDSNSLDICNPAGNSGELEKIPDGKFRNGAEGANGGQSGRRRGCASCAS